MTVTYNGTKKICARMGAIAMVAFGATACSSLPDWVDPNTWIGDSGPSDSEASPGKTPDLATIPDRPAPTSTADEQQQVTASLAADRSRAKYSSDALRGGTEAAAAPPPPSAVSASDIAAQPSPTQPTPTPAAEPATSTDQSDNSPTVDASEHATAPPPPAPAVASSELPPAQPASAQTYAPPASTYAQPAPQPAPAMAMVSPSDAALGFKPSTAPPLDASVGQFVAPPIIARYDRTASSAGAASTGMAALSASHAAYSGSQGLPPTSVVLFPGDGTLLNAEALLQVRAAVEAFKRAGGQGFVRVVGHASSRTSNMPVEKHLEVIFNKSQDRANAVAKEIIREGVPASRVLVEAVGDSQPVYYESMPKGEDGNRRAEIFLQS